MYSFFKITIRVWLKLSASVINSLPPELQKYMNSWDLRAVLELWTSADPKGRSRGFTTTFWTKRPIQYIFKCKYILIIVFKNIPAPQRKYFWHTGSHLKLKCMKFADSLKMKKKKKIEQHFSVSYICDAASIITHFSPMIIFSWL